MCIRDRYKQWLTEKQEIFEQYFTEYDASEELFNKLNLIVPQIKKVLKSLTDWYANVQDIVSDVWDNSRAYADAKNLLISYGLQYEQSYSIGLSINPVTLAKKNRTKAKLLHKQKSKALNAETAIRQALFRLESELSAFNQGVIRTPNGKFINLVAVSYTHLDVYKRQILYSPGEERSSVERPSRTDRHGIRLSVLHSETVHPEGL